MATPRAQGVLNATAHFNLAREEVLDPLHKRSARSARKHIKLGLVSSAASYAVTHSGPTAAAVAGVGALVAARDVVQGIGHWWRGPKHTDAKARAAMRAAMMTYADELMPQHDDVYKAGFADAATSICVRLRENGGDVPGAVQYIRNALDIHLPRADPAHSMQLAAWGDLCRGDSTKLKVHYQKKRSPSPKASPKKDPVQAAVAAAMASQEARVIARIAEITRATTRRGARVTV